MVVGFTDEKFLREHCLQLNLLQFSHSVFCKNVGRLAVARACNGQRSDIFIELIVGKL